MPARSPPSPRPRSVLTVAGADSGGGAGIAADLRVFEHFGVHGLAAITAVTAQNTRAVASIHPVPARAVVDQMDAVLADFDVASVKTGMLASRAIVRAVARRLAAGPGIPLVVDPVLRAGSGKRLLDRGALADLRIRLFPRARLVTPNLPELALLTGRTVDSVAAIAQSASDLLADGAGAVLVKGGHGEGDRLHDRLYLADGTRLSWQHRRRRLRTHGTGCTLASAVAAGLALGLDLPDAVDRAIRLVQDTLARPWRPALGEVCLLRP